jgi:membrane fusion protein, multidrug efflux system
MGDAAMGRSIVAILFALLPAVCGAQERNFRLSSELAAVEGWIIGVTVPSLEVTLSNEVAGEVEAISKAIGMRFNEGDVLLRFDCTLLELQQEKSEAIHSLKKEQFRVLKRLFELESVGAEDIAIAKSELKSAEVDLEVAQYSVQKCTILAPINGVVAEIMVAPFEYTQPRTPLIRIFSTDAIDVRMSVPLQNLSDFSPGAAVDVLFNPDQGPLLGAIHAVAPEINSVSQLVDVLIRISAPPAELKHGAAVGVKVK